MDKQLLTRPLLQQKKKKIKKYEYGRRLEVKIRAIFYGENT
jgi:hypothetical protein